MGTNASSKKSVAWKVLAIFLAALMIVTALPMTAFASDLEGRPGGGGNGGQGESYLITFNANGGRFEGGLTTVTMASDGNGKLSKLPDEPEFAGYDFDGWFNESIWDVTTNTTFNADTTVYADWDSNLLNFGAAMDESFAPAGTRIVDGMRLVSQPCDDCLTYAEGETLYLDDINYEANSDCGFLFTVYFTVEGDSTKTKYAARGVDLDNLGNWGIVICDEFNGYIKSGVKLDMSYNNITFAFHWGPVGDENIFDTGVTLNILPKGSLMASVAKYGFYNRGQYVIVADKSTAIGQKESERVYVGANNANTLLGESVVVNGEDVNVPSENTTWRLQDSNQIDDEDSEYDGYWQLVFTGKDSTKYLAARGLNEFVYVENAPVEFYEPSNLPNDYTWYIEDPTGGEMFLLRQEKDGVGNDINVPYYLAVDGKYFYITKDKTKAASISIYEIYENEVIDIEIASNPSKMIYNEGDVLDPTGLSVNLIYANDYTRNVTADLFNAFGIGIIFPNEGAILTNKQHDDQPIVVGYDIYTDTSDVDLTVNARVAAEYVVPAANGKLDDGQYVIVWSTEDLTKLSATDWTTATALNSESVSLQRGWIMPFYAGNSTYEASTLSSFGVEILNKKLDAVETIPDSAVWNIKSTGNGYTIQDYNGNYLTRQELSDNELFALYINNNALVLNEQADMVQAYVQTTAATDGVLAPASDYTWIISGIQKASVESFAADENSFYLTNVAGLWLAVDSTVSEETADFYKNYIYFFKKVTQAITGIAVDTQPVLNYVEGSELNLHAMVATLTYADGNTINVPFDSFATYGITVSIADGTALAYAQNGTKITLSVDGVSATTDTLSISKKPIKSIVPSNLTLNKTSYTDGDKLDVLTLTLTVTYQDGTVKVIELADFEAEGVVLNPADGYELTTAGNLVATYEGFDVICGALDVNAITSSVKRIYGNTRIATAIEISKAGWISSDVVVLASALKYPDALAGVTLAGAYDAPVLLTNGSTLEADVLAEIKRLGAKKVFVLGGKSSIAEDVATALNGFTVIRVDGNDRYETSVNIAKYVAEVKGTPSEIFFVSGETFADALSISPVAALKGCPVLYVNSTGELNKAVANYINSKPSTVVATTIVGGESSISEAIYNQLTAAFTSKQRIAGSTRYATALEIINGYASLFTSRDIAVATGENFPDALAAGAYAAKYSMPMFLVKDAATAASVATYIDNNKIIDVYAFGGLSTIPQAVLDAFLA